MVGSNSLPPLPRIQPEPQPAVNQAEQSQKAPPSPAAFVHRVRRARLIIEQLGVQSSNPITLVVEGATLSVRARGYEIAVFGVEKEHQPHQDCEEPLIQMALTGTSELGNAIGFGPHATHVIARGERRAPGPLTP